MHKVLTLTQESFFLKSIVFFLSICLFSLSGLFSLPLLFSPVPLVLQVNVALLYGAIFGSRKSFFLLLSCYVLAIMGVPMFANGASSVAYFFGPTGGYLIGYLFAAFAMGKLMERKQPTSSLQLFHYFLLANSIVYACGVPVLSGFIGWKMALSVGLLPFIPGAILKNVFFAKALFSLKKTTY